MAKFYLLILLSTLALGTGCNLTEKPLEEETIEDVKTSNEEDTVLTLNSSAEHILKVLYAEDRELKNASSIMMGKPYINFLFEDINKKVSSLNDIEGPFILEIMSATCSTCQALQPHVEDFKLKQEIPIITVSYLENREELNQLEDVMDTHLVHTLREDVDLVDMYGLKYVPAFYFIDEDGIIQFVAVGDTDIETLDYLTRRFLAKR